MSMSAEKERKFEDNVAGVKPKGKSGRFWADRFITEFALMARKLRRAKDLVDENGNPVKEDEFTPIINRQLYRVKQAIDLLENNPQIAKDCGESGEGIEEILEMLDRRAAELDTEDIVNEYARKVRTTLPGARLNAAVKGVKKAGDPLGSSGSASGGAGGSGTK
jgi:hypothetical protein